MSVELLGLLPVMALLSAVAWQGALAGHAWWIAAESARLGGRAYATADARREADPGRSATRVARGALPASLRAAADLHAAGADGAVTVRVRMPLAPPIAALTGRSSGPAISARSRFVE